MHTVRKYRNQVKWCSGQAASGWHVQAMATPVPHLESGIGACNAGGGGPQALVHEALQGVLPVVALQGGEPRLQPEALHHRAGVLQAAGLHALPRQRTLQHNPILHTQHRQEETNLGVLQGQGHHTSWQALSVHILTKVHGCTTPSPCTRNSPFNIRGRRCQ